MAEGFIPKIPYRSNSGSEAKNQDPDDDVINKNLNNPHHIDYTEEELNSIL
jgi:hypothetical protein